MESTKTYHILNLGAGVQSTALYLMFVNGDFDENLDYAVFADTQEEPESVYRHLEWLRSLGGPQILIDTAGKLGDDLIHGKNSTGRWTCPCVIAGRGDDAARSVLDDGKLVVAHAGTKAEMQGRGSARPLASITDPLEEPDNPHSTSWTNWHPVYC